MYHAPIISGGTEELRLPELVAALSYALDLTEGQPAGHSQRACWIAMAVGRSLRLPADELSDLYYAVLLKDLGCSSNAARICELYEADDRAFKAGYKTVGTSLAATLHFVFSRTAQGAPLSQRAAAIGNILRNGREIAQEMILSRCTRGADIARSLGFSDAVCQGIYRLDEHWDGSGRPGRLVGNEIPLFARIALLAQIADVFHAHAGRQAALDEVRRRSGNWLDPALVAAFEEAVGVTGFWETLASPCLESRLVALLPAQQARAVDDDELDRIAGAFGEVIDAKSPYTAGHSRRVADLAAALGQAVGVGGGNVRRLWRGALLHDIGKLGVSNSVLDKPAALDGHEWEEMRAHAAHTQEILGRVGVMRDLAPIAAAHHERLDGTGYPLRLSAAQIGTETRIITTCDIFDALTSDRPYRAAMPVTEALSVMAGEVGTAIDPDCFDALRSLHG